MPAFGVVYELIFRLVGPSEIYLGPGEILTILAGTGFLLYEIAQWRKYR